MQMVRYCPVCDDEFRPEITVCSDCGSTLILQKEGLGAQGVKDVLAGERGDAEGVHAEWRTALDGLPVSNLIPVRTFDSLTDLEPAVASFAQIELPSRVLVQNGRYLLLIRPQDVGEAQAALHTALVDAEDSPDPAFDTTAGRYSNCPACGGRLAENFTGECPECGLELTGPGMTVTLPEVG
ncbi:MAG: hypothetical protein ABI565_11360 [Vicinamibacteria bacterium]